MGDKVRKAGKPPFQRRDDGRSVSCGAAHSLVSQSVRRQKRQAEGAQLLSKAEQRRGATARLVRREVGRGQPVRASERAPAPRPEARTGCRKADAGRSQTVAERQAAPRLPVPKWGAKSPGARAGQARETRSRRTQ